jgi:hypothetical protein
VKILTLILSGVVEYVFTAKSRLHCIRHGHLFLCTVDGHLCRTCGRQWCHY